MAPAAGGGLVKDSMEFLGPQDGGFQRPSLKWKDLNQLSKKLMSIFGRSTFREGDEGPLTREGSKGLGRWPLFE